MYKVKKNLIAPAFSVKYSTLYMKSETTLSSSAAR